MDEDEQSAAARADRVALARIAAYSSWAKTEDRSARTRRARAAFLARFENEVDSDRVLRVEVRRQRAEAAKRAYFYRLSLKSAKKRRER